MGTRAQSPTLYRSSTSHIPLYPSLTPPVKIRPISWTLQFINLHLLQQLVSSYKPFSKPTNHHLYVHSQSHHPVATKKSIIRGETIRLMRSCSNKNVFQSSLIQLKLSFRDRGYTNPFINSAMQNLPDFQHRYDKTAKESNPDTTMFFF